MSLEDLRAIVVPVLIVSGDDDVAQLTHTVSMYEAIPEAQLAVIPGASHGVLKEQPKLCRAYVRALSAWPGSSRDPVHRCVARIAARSGEPRAALVLHYT